MLYRYLEADMLKKFEVRNFKGFKETIVFDLSSRYYSFNSNLVENGIVKKGIIYGKNGTGKSNLGIALFDIVASLTDKQRMNPEYIMNYINCDTEENFAVFKYYFQFEDKEIKYEYAKTDIDSFVFERFYVEDVPFFEYYFRDKSGSFISDSIKQYINFDSIVDNKLSIVKYIGRGVPKNTFPEITKLIEFVEGMLWFRSLSDGNSYAGLSVGVSFLSEVLYEHGKLSEFTAFLKANGIDYRLKFRPENGRHQLYALFEHGEVPFDSVASTGTKALLLVFVWSLSFENVTFLFIDEFDAFLHFESAASIIEMLNKTSFQSFVTTHNTYLMKNKYTRPDACFIISNNKINPLCKCTDKEIREAHNLEKMYENGVFNE